jgi:tetratricopeptide (TPR) repeat protein
MSNVEVAAVGQTGSTFSDDLGRFTLQFPQKRVGDLVQIIVKKEGYVIVNSIQTEKLALPADGHAAPLTIILAKEPEREEMVRRFYQLKSFEAIEETYRRRLKELEDKQASAAALAELQQERDQAKAAAGKASQELAKNQPGQSSELYQEAKRLFLAGKIDESLTVLEDKKLLQPPQTKKAIEDAVQAWLLKAQLVSLRLRFKDAEAGYLKALEIAPDSFAANFAYAGFNRELNRDEKARIAYERCLHAASQYGNDTEVAQTLNKLGNIDSDQSRVKEARQEFEEALEIRRELAQKEPETYLPDVAQTLNYLGDLDRDTGRVKEARQEFEEALEIRRELAQKEPETYLPDIAQTLKNLGLLDSRQNRLIEARQASSSALKIYRELAQKKSDQYLPEVAETLKDLGMLDRALNRFDEARTTFKEALEIYQFFAGQDPEKFSADVARVQKLLEELPAS